MKWTRHALHSCTVARLNIFSLLRWALHGGDVSTWRPKRDQICAPSETKFTPQASQNLRPKRTFAQQYMPETAQTSSREEHDQKEKTIHFPIFSYMFSITCDMLGASRPI
jgi:hypothetical protein